MNNKNLARIADDLSLSSLWDMFKEDPSTRSLDSVLDLLADELATCMLEDSLDEGTCDVDDFLGEVDSLARKLKDDQEVVSTAKMIRMKLLLRYGD